MTIQENLKALTDSYKACKEDSEEVFKLVADLHKNDDNYFYSSEWWDACENMDFEESQKICQFLDKWEEKTTRSSSWILNFICGM